MKPIAQLVAAVLLALLPSKSHGEIILTGLTVYSTFADGNFRNLDFWDTSADNFAFNVYLTSPNAGINGPFANASDGAALAPNISLPLGTHTLFMFGEPGRRGDFYGANLYLDGDHDEPAVSVFAELNTSTTSPFPPIAPTAGETYHLTGERLPGAGTLSAVSGGEVLTVTEFFWAPPETFSLDRVMSRDLGTSGMLDFVGMMTVEITEVREPGTYMSLAVAMLLVALPRGRAVAQCATRGRICWHY